MTRTGLFARSHNGPPTHASFDYAKQLHSWIKSGIAPELEIYGEYTFAIHSIHYPDMHDFFHVFAVRDSSLGMWADWDYTQDLASSLGLNTVPMLERGTAESVEELQRWTTLYAHASVSSYGPEQEGIVVRVENAFADADFSRSLAKWVRADHVQTDAHWTNQPIVRQGTQK